jgi:hypothetical protein
MCKVDLEVTFFGLIVNQAYDSEDDRLIDWFAVWVTPMHLGLKLQALCAPLLVPSVNSRGTPCRCQRPLLAREEIRREMANKFCL